MTGDYEYFVMNCLPCGGNGCYGIWGVVRCTKHCIASAPVAADPLWIAHAVRELNRRQTPFDLFAELLLSGMLQSYIDA